MSGVLSAKCPHQGISPKEDLTCRGPPKEGLLGGELISHHSRIVVGGGSSTFSPRATAHLSVAALSFPYNGWEIGPGWAGVLPAMRRDLAAGRRSERWSSPLPLCPDDVVGDVARSLTWRRTRRLHGETTQFHFTVRTAVVGVAGFAVVAEWVVVGGTSNISLSRCVALVDTRAGWRR